MGIFFTQQNLAVVNYDYGNTDEGSIMHIFNFFFTTKTPPVKQDKKV